MSIGGLAGCPFLFPKRNKPIKRLILTVAVMLLAVMLAASTPAFAQNTEQENKATEQPIDTSTAAGKCALDMLGVFAEFETNLRKERQLEGIAKAKAAGIYKGRKRKVPID